MDMQTNTFPIMRLSGISKSYTQEQMPVAVLRDISFDLLPGEFVIISGASGAGKTTLMKILGGLENPSAGSFLVEGDEYAGASVRKRAQYRRDKVGFVFQGYNLIANLTAYENIRIALEIARLPIGAAIEDALRWVGLCEKRNSFPSQLSGGEQQRVAIARALAKSPEIILADEPTGALDEKTGIEIIGLLEKAVREQRRTVVMITHNPSFLPVADRIIELSSGHIKGIRTQHPRSIAFAESKNV